jgi:hypothetical protein
VRIECGARFHEASFDTRGLKGLQTFAVSLPRNARRFKFGEQEP